MNVVARYQAAHRVGDDVNVPGISILLRITDVFTQLLRVFENAAGRICRKEGATGVHNSFFRFFADRKRFPIIAVCRGQDVLPRFPRLPIAPKSVHRHQWFWRDFQVLCQFIGFLPIVFQLCLDTLDKSWSAIVIPCVAGRVPDHFHVALFTRFEPD